MLARSALLVAVASVTASSLEAVVPSRSPLADKTFRHPRLEIPQEHDARAGRLSSLIVSEPLVPGTGVGNTLRWADLGGRPADEGAMKDAVWSAVLGYLQQHERALRVDVAELVGAAHRHLRARRPHPGLLPARAERHPGARLRRDRHHQPRQPRPPRPAELGRRRRRRPPRPQIAADQARLVVSQHVQPFFIDSYAKDAHLEYIPMVSGDGYEFRLVWAVRATVQGDIGTWEGLVDAVSGELIAFEDKNQYAARKVDRRRLPGQQRPASAGRHRAGRLAHALPQRHHARRARSPPTPPAPSAA